MTDEEIEYLSRFIYVPDLFFERLSRTDKKLYEDFLQQALLEIQKTLGKG